MNFHNELNPKLWDKHGDVYTLKPEVAEKLNEIAEAFIEYMEINPDAVKDIVITGSSASFNYTPHSDLDLHLKVDYDLIHEDCPIVEGFLWALKSTFNKDHDISIYGVPVEVYAEPLEENAVSNGIYSLRQGKWLKVPQPIEPTDNDAAVLAKYNELKEACERIKDSEVAQELLDKIYEMRKAGLSDVGEFSTENLAFKKLRDDGIIDRLKEMKKEQIDKELSLESYNENDNNAKEYEKEYKQVMRKIDKLSNKMDELRDSLDYADDDRQYNRIVSKIDSLGEQYDYWNERATELERILAYYNINKSESLKEKIDKELSFKAYNENKYSKVVASDKSQRLQSLQSRRGRRKNIKVKATGQMGNSFEGPVPMYKDVRTGYLYRLRSDNVLLDEFGDVHDTFEIVENHTKNIWSGQKLLKNGKYGATKKLSLEQVAQSIYGFGGKELDDMRRNKKICGHYDNYYIHGPYTDELDKLVTQMRKAEFNESSIDLTKMNNKLNEALDVVSEYGTLGNRTPEQHEALNYAEELFQMFKGKCEELGFKVTETRIKDGTARVGTATAIKDTNTNYNHKIVYVPDKTRITYTVTKNGNKETEINFPVVVDDQDIDKVFRGLCTEIDGRE